MKMKHGRMLPQMNLEDVTLSESSQTQKPTHCRVPFPCKPE